jgi:hypothetical protein
LLDNLRKVFKELGDASMMKEALRSIYHMAGIGALLPDKLKSKNLLPWQKL